ncbi:SMP-30/gluconolactonase/LRE family protein [Bradyrhizobium diazoefficiens]|nr:SMP-30/gluconolactonase/LRE family protein [Bradyrhizobium diazoefficiens]APO54999.1 gluconolactonase [Bradyrhizobium diazoefficiens]KOY09921.1 gluconolactonase [Bradyrhizobium diazoefficiens]MCD9292641.1 SMP-30/gluconolactonase/LRE family protein [Bradyrhizobium diazoefficiens]MCD9811152.1 SMP-30/gluconolactonase/LRE family protein [Bradyrhizobium diazoefficiens]MCD9829016.1 SMP-30/gluconolactonase/LRE family protein [Bradyrhizobium diazoefficiens]
MTRILTNSDDTTASERGGLDRRTLLKGAATVAATALLASRADAREFGANAEPQRYPDPDIIAIDPKRFKAKVGNTAIKRLYTGCLWAEGPAWNAQGQYLVWSDIPANRQLRYLDDDGHISEQFHKPSNEANGNSFDTEGRQISAERTRLVRYEHDGSVTTLAEQAGGKPLNGPNDMVVHPNDKAIWFTDPGYGAISIYEGKLANTGSLQPYQKEAVYRLDTQTGQVAKVADEPFKPNGIAFSHDYKKLYVCDTGITHYPQAENVVWSYDIDGSKLSNPKRLIDMKLDGKSGFPDGLRVDTEGNIWVGAGWVGPGYDGVQVFAPNDGARIGQILLPETCANVCFGGRKRNRLFMTASQSLYAVYVETQGAHFC